MYLKSLQAITSKLTIYYDGSCPLCLAEIHFLKHHNQKGLLEFVSLQELNADVDYVNCELAFKTIHARLGEREIIVGPDVFYEAYKRTNLRFINFVFSFSVARFMYGKFYVLFAKYRHQISKVIGPMLLSYVQRRYTRGKSIQA
jgi:predicted DCC family thiol-disulfide oxidoreductase YuxK